MIIRNALLCAALVAGAGFVSVPASAREYVEVEVAPPVVRTEVIPERRHGYVWAPGYWEWRGHEHVWVEGRWIVARHGFHWVPEHWVEYHHHWRFEPGIWVRD